MDQALIGIQETSRDNQGEEGRGGRCRMLWSSCNAASAWLFQFGAPRPPDRLKRINLGRQIQSLDSFEVSRYDLPTAVTIKLCSAEIKWQEQLYDILHDWEPMDFHESENQHGLSIFCDLYSIFPFPINWGNWPFSFIPRQREKLNSLWLLLQRNPY